MTEDRFEYQLDYDGVAGARVSLYSPFIRQYVRVLPTDLFQAQIQKRNRSANQAR